MALACRQRGEACPRAPAPARRPAVTRMALTGVRKRGWTRPKNGGRSPCSASANRLREPDSACPMLLPDVETTAPSVISAAPAGPRNRAAASASGVFDVGEPGQRAERDDLRQRHDDRHDDDRHDRARTAPCAAGPSSRRRRPARLRSRRTRRSAAGPSPTSRASVTRPPAPKGARSRSQNRPSDDEDDQRHELADRQRVDDQAALPDAADVDGRNRRDDGG